MKNNKYLLNTLLAVVVGTVLMIAMLVRTFVPSVVLTPLNIPACTALSLVALLIEFYSGNRAERCWICLPLLGLATFGILPLASGAITTDQLIPVTLVGGGVFSVVTWVFDSLMERITSGPNAKLAPISTAIMLFLVSQCFIGILI